MLLADRYRLGMPLGSGGMGEVWTAVDERLNRPVAVKLLTGLAKSDSRARFHREARIAARLEHPRIVTVYDFGMADDRCFLTTELVNGPSLAHELRRRGRLSPARVVAAAAQAAEGLAEAHRQGVVHGNVKPSNLLLDENGMVKIADFGVAWCPGSQPTTYPTGAGQAAGAALYPAPEVATGAEAGAPGDVYALACTLYELLTGSPGITGGYPGAVSSQDLPDAYGGILLRMLANSPDERPQAREVADWFARIPGRADGHVADLDGGEGSVPAKPAATARHAAPVAKTVAASAGAAADSTEPVRRRRRWPVVTGAVTTAAAITAGVVALTTPATGGAPGTGSFPQPTASDSAVSGPAAVRGIGQRSPGAYVGNGQGQSGSPLQIPADSLSRPAVAGSAAAGSVPSVAASPSRPSTAVPTTAPPTTVPPSATPSPSTSPSTSPSPTASGPSSTTGRSVFGGGQG
jgi:eukaryotic-like serine/threonine-protein kinase